MPVDAVERVVDVWTALCGELMSTPRIGHTQLCENRGEQMGGANPAPHGQIWATEHVPMHVAREDPSVLADYVAQERERVVEENQHFVACVPYWAVWPFETLVASRRAVATLLELTGEERASLADVL